MSVNAIGVLISAVSAVVAIWALVVAYLANNVANEGNAIAEGANDIAVDALREAQDANVLATNANALAGDANEIAERALRAAQDDVPYNWTLTINDDGSAIVLNDCGHGALDAKVTLDSESRPIAEAGPVDLAAFDKIMLDAASTMDRHFEAVRANPPTYAHSEGGLSFGGSAGKPVETEFRVHLRWTTEQGVPRTDVVRTMVRHQMTQGGLQPWAPKKPRTSQ